MKVFEILQNQHAVGSRRSKKRGDGIALQHLQGSLRIELAPVVPDEEGCPHVPGGKEAGPCRLSPTRVGEGPVKIRGPVVEPVLAGNDVCQRIGDVIIQDHLGIAGSARSEVDH